MNRLLGCLVMLALSGCGLIKVNINGQEHTLGGSSSAPGQAASASKSSTGSPREVVANDNRKVETVSLDPSLTDTPRLVEAKGVALDASAYHKLGNASPDCASQIASKPVAIFKLEQDMPKTFTVAVHGGYDDGFILMKSGTWWAACTERVMEVPEMAAPKEGWTAGTYEIYPVTRRNKMAADFTVEFYNPAKPTPWDDKVQKLDLSKKLAKPLFVTVNVRPDRVKLREDHAGSGCKVALPTEPDLALTLERPIPGLTIRPLFTKTPVTLRVQTPADKNQRTRKYCPAWRREVVASGYAPSYESPAEMHFGNQDEGTFGISVGTPNAGETLPVTLMIFDASTKFDALAAVPPQGDLAMDQRGLAPYYPQLDERELALHKGDSAVLAAKLFASAPKQLFVYSKLDQDKDIARNLDGMASDGAFPRKNEPLLVLGYDSNDYVNVLTADGLEYSVKSSHLLAQPDGAVAAPKSPRRLKKDLRFEYVLDLMPASARPIKAAYDARNKKYNACADRVWKPYGKQLDGATWTIHDSQGPDVTVESPRAQRIKDAGNAAIAKQCGSDAAIAKDEEATRVKILAAVEKQRDQLLAQAEKNF